ncbi:hypothetical protein [Rhodoferax sp.]|uniref:hypothetical protein n=1 Tax=Rhodoferax sp. TaxID=50421 RepID=UPI002769FE2D|nr:PHB depolymerase family esterase [Rhodoferax sp.]
MRTRRATSFWTRAIQRQVGVITRRAVRASGKMVKQTLQRSAKTSKQAGFMVVYPEQSRLANLQACWNWFDTRSGRALAQAPLRQEKPSVARVIRLS